MTGHETQKAPMGYELPGSKSSQGSGSNIEQDNRQDGNSSQHRGNACY